MINATNTPYNHSFNNLIHKTNFMKTLKQDVTVKFMDYGEITIPAGTMTNNSTAMGVDPNYNFVCSFEWIDSNYPEINRVLRHDAEYHGIDIPTEFLQS